MNGYYCIKHVEKLVLLITCYSALSEKDTLDGEGKLLKACNILKDGSLEEKKILYIVGAGNSTSVQTAFLSDDFFTGSPDETNERRAGES